MVRTVLSAFLLLAALAAAPQPSAAQSASPSAPAPLGIVLTGTLQQEGADLALILDTSQKRERVYSVQDCVPRRGANKRGNCDADQGQLVRINADTIVVAIAGKQHVVKMGKGITQAKPVSRPTRPSRPSRASRASQRAEAEADPAADADEAEDAADADVEEEEEEDLPEEEEPEPDAPDTATGRPLGSN